MPDSPDNSSVLSRRDFITATAVSLASIGAGCAALSPLMGAEEVPGKEEFLQKHYKQLSTQDKKSVFQRLEAQTLEQTGVKATIEDPQPMDGVEFAYVLNIGRCIGCRRCVYACMNENNQSRNPEIQYIRVMKMKKGSIDLETSDHDYPVNEAADPDYFYLPVQCQQCRNPPCVKVCPVKATWQGKDGITVVDYNWCIGCRYCEAACPFHARRFNWGKGKIAPADINPEMAYLSNRLRPVGVMEKCTFCLQRTRRGLYPACLEVCPTGARKFGNLRDPQSEVRRIIENERVFVLKQDLGTTPRFYYVFAK
jgi:Fe-S-cluster-containing dehydrogenase component